MRPAVDDVTARELLDSLGQAVIATDLDGVITYVNPAAERLYGWPAADAVGRNILEVTVPQLSQEMAADIMAALRAGGTWSGGFPVQRRDGTVFPALVTDAGITRHGQLVGIVGVSANVGTALQPLLERSSDAAFVVRSDGVIQYASPAVEALFGWQADALTGTSLLELVHPDDRDTLVGGLQRPRGRPQPPAELRVRSGADWVWAEGALTNLLDDPIVRGVVCNLRHSVRRAEQLAAEARAGQLEQALQSRVVIEQAKGFLAARTGTTPDAAFEVLRRYARDHNLTAQAVAARILAGTAVP